MTCAHVGFPCENFGIKKLNLKAIEFVTAKACCIGFLQSMEIAVRVLGSNRKIDWSQVLIKLTGTSTQLNKLIRQNKASN